MNGSQTIEPVQPVVTVGDDPSRFQHFTGSLICDLFNASLESIETRWMLPNGSYITDADNTPDKFTILTNLDNLNRSRTLLFINSLSYMDNGTYSCEVRENGSMNGSWAIAHIDLVLLGELNCFDYAIVVMIFTSPTFNITEKQHLHVD